MKRILDDYRFDNSLRYEEHLLHYLPEGEDEMILGGIMGAAVLCALLADTDEGDARGITVDGEVQRNDLFDRYEREVRRDNGGLFLTEVVALSNAYMELTDTDALMRICRNDRLCDLAIGLVVDYMHRLVVEQTGTHIYDAVPWCTPFAQWLFEAGYAETKRQRLLAINWTDSAAVYALSQELQSNNAPEPIEPTFYFEGENAERLMEYYFRWLWAQVQAQAAMMPDAKVQLAQFKPEVLEQETNWDFIRPELKDLLPEHINLFRKWMNEWTDFIRKRLETAPQPQRKEARQELFIDDVIPCPKPHSYAAVREYIQERSKYDAEFKKYVKIHKRTDLCRQLSFMFGWTVDDNALGHSMNRKLKHPKKIF